MVKYAVEIWDDQLRKWVEVEAWEVIKACEEMKSNLISAVGQYTARQRECMFRGMLYETKVTTII